MPARPELERILRESWVRLAAAARTPGSPLRTPVLGTLSPRGPELRTVILRRADADARELWCHADRRSPKVSHIADRSEVVWVFYDRHYGPQGAVQLRLRGRATVETDTAAAERQWRATPPARHADYASYEPPGTELACGPGPGRGRSGPPVDPRANFALIRCRVDELDWLRLAPHGNRRARFRWRPARGWQGRCLTP